MGRLQLSLMLVFVLAHMILGMRTVTMDYVKGGKRTLTLSVLYLAGAFVFMMGTIVVMTVKLPGA